jgi:hypothetical protein
MSLRAVQNAVQTGKRLVDGKVVHRATAMTMASERTTQSPAQTAVVRHECLFSQHRENQCTAMIAIRGTVLAVTRYSYFLFRDRAS